MILRSLASCLGLLALTLGCAAPTPHLATDHGDAYRAAFEGQVANPNAPNDPEPVEGMPGGVAHRLYQEKYVESLLTEPEVEPSVSEQVREIR